MNLNSMHLHYTGHVQCMNYTSLSPSQECDYCHQNSSNWKAIPIPQNYHTTKGCLLTLSGVGSALIRTDAIHQLYQLKNAIRWHQQYSSFTCHRPQLKLFSCPIITYPSLIPRPFPPPVFDCLQYAKTEGRE